MLNVLVFCWWCSDWSFAHVRVLVCSLHFQHLLLHRNPESLPFQCRLSQVVLEYWPLNGDDDDDDDDKKKCVVLS